MEPAVGFEPTTYCLQNSCSTPELHRQSINNKLKLPDYLISSTSFLDEFKTENR